MYSYLNKKVQMSNGSHVRSVGWDLLDDWIAIGASRGVLKLFHINSRIMTIRPGGSVTEGRGDFASATLTDFQSLQGHTDDIHLVNWNPVYGKLATADMSGAIVVWQLQQGNWQQEMMNNRSKSSVQAIKWSNNGKYICIAYADGNIILGDVNGKRLWTRDLDSVLRCVEWSPCDQFLLFTDDVGRVVLHDLKGVTVAQVPNHTIAKDDASPAVVCTAWHKALVTAPQDSSALSGSENAPQPSPCLCVAYANGRAQVLRNAVDPEPVLLDTGLVIRDVKWSPDGTLLAIGGHTRASTETAMGAGAGAGATEQHKVYFYSSKGQYLRCMPLPAGEVLVGLAWECSSQRVVVASNGCLYFAAVRRPHHALYFQHTLMFAHTPNTRSDVCLYFYNLKKAERQAKYVDSVLCTATSTTYCALAVTVPSRPSRAVLIVCNTIGLAVNTQQLDFLPTSIAMSDTHIAAANDQCVYIWHFGVDVPDTVAQAIAAVADNYSKGKGSEALATDGSLDQLSFLGPDSSQLREERVAMLQYPFGDPALLSSAIPPITTRRGTEFFFHVDEHSTNCVLLRPNSTALHAQRAHARAARADGSAGAGAGVDEDEDAYAMEEMVTTMGDAAQRLLSPSRTTANPVTALDVKHDIVAVCRASGSVVLYRMPACSVVARATIPGRPERCWLNVDASKCAIVDIDSVLRIVDVQPADAKADEPLLEEGLSARRITRRQWDSKDFVRGNVWRFSWAADSVDAFAFQEKGKLTVFVNGELDSSVPCQQYIVSFRDLQVTTAHVDELSIAPHAVLPEHVTHFPTRQLLEFQAQAQATAAGELVSQLQALPAVHPCLWRHAAIKCLREDAIADAEVCFRGLEDVDGMSFARALLLVSDSRKRAVEVEAYTGNLSRVVQMCAAVGRDDLAVSAMARVGEYEGALAVLSQSVDANAREEEECWRQLGLQCLANHAPRRALQCFLRISDMALIVQACHALDDYSALLPLLHTLPPHMPSLPELARRLGQQGHTDAAVQCYLQARDVQGAVDVCVRTQQWGVAVQLAETYRMPQVHTLLAQYAEVLIGRGRLVQAAHMYYKAQRYGEVLGVLGRVSERILQSGLTPAGEGDGGEGAPGAEGGRAGGSGAGALSNTVQLGSISGNTNTTSLLSSTTTGAGAGDTDATSNSNSESFFLTMGAVRTLKRVYVLQGLVAMCELAQEDGLGADGTVSAAAVSKTQRTLDFAHGGLGMGGGGTRKPAAIGADTRSLLAAATQATLRNLASKGASSSLTQALVRPWRGAEACHWYLLAQRQLFAGDVLAALRTARVACEFEDVLGGACAQALLAVSALAAEQYGWCSQALSALSAHALRTGDSKRREAFERLAVRVFMQHPPTTTTDLFPAIRCRNCRATVPSDANTCGQCSQEVSVCVATGQRLSAEDSAVQCRICRHLLRSEEAAVFKCCPLCHQEGISALGVDAAGV